nr:hypothetical protein [Tanacetum cinerariifolium]
MRVESVNGKKYILFIIDDYSRFTWVRLNVPVRRIRTDNGTEFVNQTLREYYEEVGISHETSVARYPQQNGVVKRRNQTLIEAARTIMTTLPDKAILSGADNRPPMLEKDMYDSWKSRMELYMLNRQHGQMILESVENGPLLWPTIEENGVTRPKKYSELSATEAIQADCDVKATNIILQGLPPEVYAFVSNHKVAKALWERIQLLMQGTSLTKQEKECKLYD